MPGDASSTDFDIDLLIKNLSGASVPALIMTTAQLTGDKSILRDQWKPDNSIFVEDGGYSAEDRAQIIEYCAERLRQVFLSRAEIPSGATYEEVRNAAFWLMGPVADPYLPLLRDRLIFDEDPNAPSWSAAKMDSEANMEVAIIGAGESGLLAAYRMQQAGIAFKIYDRGSDVGGTWNSNRYPGARVDVNSFVYSYSFLQKPWDNYYALREEVAAYLKDFAVDQGIIEHIEFNSEVTDCRWDEDAATWELTIQNGRGEKKARSQILISAVGQLSRKKMPQTPGMEKFKGALFHSSEWPDDLDVSGRRVAVIGNGASAMQLVPEIAKQAESLTIFYRNPTWLFPRSKLYKQVSESERWLMEHLPHYMIWYRAFEITPQLIGWLDAATIDPSFPPTEFAVSQTNADFRGALENYIDEQIVNRPDLRPLVVPDTPFAAKRFVCDDGAWLSALQRDNVALVREPIDRIDEDGISTTDGRQHPFDIIIYGTGFEASKFLMPMRVEGKGGVDLHEMWGDDARAYLGVTIPNFPNLFMLYGPNTNFLVHGASIFNLSECTMTYVMEAVRFMTQSGNRWIDVKSRVHELYNDRLDNENSQLAWGWSKVSNWYKNSKGRVTQNLPYSMYEYHERLKFFDHTDYEYGS